MILKIKTIKTKFFGIFIVALMLYLLFFYSFIKNNFSENQKTNVQLKHIVVHLDLKGAPPKMKYLKSLLPLLRDLGVNGILMEYEDMFPYEGKLVNLSSRNRYNRAELKNFLLQAVQYQIQIIPLIQTFGHMEHVLKLKEFQHLREVDLYPDSICPSNDGSLRLLKEMLKQVINFHKNITPLKNIHIGCDEVFHLNECKKCRFFNNTNREIYIRHILAVKNIVLNMSPSTTILVWDDMIRNFLMDRWVIEDTEKLQQIEPVYWDYTPNLSVTNLSLYLYHKYFKNIWISSAYKGADGRLAMIPDDKKRFHNHFSWMSLIINYIFAGEAEVHNFEGIILTGWSRYSHMDPLCELLPAAIPSLVLNLLLIQRFKIGFNILDVQKSPDAFFDKYLKIDFYRYLHCGNSVTVQNHRFRYIKNFEDISDSCSFKGNDVFNLLKDYKILTSEIYDNFNNEIEYSIEYYTKIKTVNINNVEGTVDECKTVVRKVNQWEKSMRKVMSEYYDEFVIQEFVGYKTYAAKKKVIEIWKMLENYTGTRNWNRNPHYTSYLLTPQRTNTENLNVI